MSHQIEKDIDVVYTPDEIPGDEQSKIWAKNWHDLNTRLPGGIQLDGGNIGPVFCPVLEVGLKPDFESNINTIPADDAEGIQSAKISFAESKVLLADCRNGIAGNSATYGKDKSVFLLHTPKKGYTVHQNRQLFDAMIKSVQKVLGNAFTVVTVGTLGGYSQFFVSIAIKGHDKMEVGKLANGTPDVYNMFYNLNSSHDGLIASNRMLSSVRIVCINTVNMSISDASNQGTIQTMKHTQNSLDLITPDAFAKDLQAWLDRGASFKATLEMLKAEKMTMEQFRAFSASVFTNEKTDMLSTTSYNRITEMEPLFTKGQGNSGETRYDAVQAWTEYFTSGNGTGKDVTPNKRVAMANFGRGNDWKNEAIKCALPIDKRTGKPSKAAFAEFLKRGNTLYADKHAVVMAGN